MEELTLAQPTISLTTQARPYLSNIRAQDWGGYLGMSMLGYLQGIGTLQQITSGYIDLGRYIVTVILYLAFSFSINNCFDHEGDGLGEKASRNPIAAGEISIRGGVVFSIILASVGLTLSSLWFGVFSLLIYGLMLLLSSAYSVPPVRFKSVPILDLTSHGLFFGSLIVLYGVSVTGGFRFETLVLTSSMFVISLIVELRNQIDDISEDSATGVHTTACYIGSSRANALFAGLLVLHMSMLIYVLNLVGDLVIFTISLIFLAGLAIQFLLEPERKRYLLLMEKVTPLVYLFFSLNILL